MKTTYEIDFYKWTQDQSRYLKNSDYLNLDVVNLIEEIESLGRSDKKSLRSHLFNLLKHLLKIEIQPEKHTRSWDETITNSRIEIIYGLKDSPSLKPFIKEIFFECYQDARNGASIETGISIQRFPTECPWTIEEVLKQGS